MTTARLDDATLRRAALEALGALADPLAREALETGELSTTDVTSWEGTTGRVTGTHAVLAVDARLRARMGAAPAVVDALVAAVAAAVAQRPGRSLVELSVGLPEGAARANRPPYR